MTIRRAASAILHPLLLWTGLALAQSPLETSFLDHEATIGDFFGKTFLKENIPFIDIPDQLIQDTYYYRWTSTQRNLRYIIAGTGYMSTEFVQPVGYAQAFGTIVAAAGHQLDEAKWLRDRSYAEDYMLVYNRGPANSTQYTEWIAHVAAQRALITGGSDSFFADQLDDMVRAFREWDKVYDADAGLYYYQPVWDAQELSLPGFIVDPDDQDWELRKDGPDTYRPSHNAYMAANARAIVEAAQLVGDGDLETEFTEIAEGLENAFHERLWASEQSFFMDVIRPNNPDLATLTGRQEVGFYPFRFGIGLSEEYAQPAVDAMFDPEGFLTEFGPPTLEVRDPWYKADKSPEEYCCYWNGQSWPYSTAHTISALGAIYRSGVTDVTADQFLDYLIRYARTQRKDGRPYVAESHLPHQDAWSQDGYNHSEHYAHSTFVNNIITDLLGVIPKSDDTLELHPIVPDNWTYFAIENLAYHGHLVTVLYDEDGQRYGQGTGLTVFVNGEEVFNGPDKIATIDIPASTGPPEGDDEPMLVNIATNPNGPGHYPAAEASYTWTADWPYKAIDGVLYYDDIPDNRWTNYRSPNPNDTLTITFARPRNISSVTLALFSDVARGGQIDLPASIEITGSNGVVLATVSEAETADLLANDVNTINLDGGIETTFLAVNLLNRPESFVGICEVEVWQPWTAPTYYAVDAFLAGGAAVSWDESSTATDNGAVVGGLGSESEIAFSGVIATTAGAASASITYSNSGDATVVVSIRVNQQEGPVLELTPTDGAYEELTVDLTLAKGRNFVSVIGGSEDIRIELLTV